MTDRFFTLHANAIRNKLQLNISTILRGVRTTVVRTLFGSLRYGNMIGRLPLKRRTEVIPLNEWSAFSLRITEPFARGRYYSRQ